MSNSGQQLRSHAYLTWFDLTIVNLARVMTEKLGRNGRIDRNGKSDENTEKRAPAAGHVTNKDGMSQLWVPACLPEDTDTILLSNAPSLRSHSHPNRQDP
jgi:hypothetical protein